MGEPLISVVMPAYNSAGTIRHAIDSALSQDAELELLVIDDGSGDGLDEVMKTYKNCPSVCYLKNEKNIGAAASRNKGVTLAKGKYIAFLDADDWWEEGKLKRQLQKLKETDTVLCCTGRELVTPQGELTGRVIPVQEEITYRQLLHQNSINCSSVLIRADVMKQFRMEHEDSHEDYLLWLKILKKYGKACGIAEPLLKYRLSSSGKSGSKWQSAKKTYLVYRYAGFHRLQSFWYFCWYALHGVWKYGRAYVKQSGQRDKAVEINLKENTQEDSLENQNAVGKSPQENRNPGQLQTEETSGNGRNGGFKFVLKQVLKMTVQNVFLPIVYRLSKKKNVEKDRIIFADAHHMTLPFSMRCLYEEAKKAGMKTEVLVSDYGHDSLKKNLQMMIRFMKSYANAGSVVICDNFLPAASCKKRKETTVVQLWHGCGALKKFGYDTAEDIPSYYKGNVLKNCDIVTVSAEACAPYFASAMRLPLERFHAVGVSRTDIYYRESFLQKVRERFAKDYPAAAGKKVILWAPTFRGNAGLARVCGEEAIDRLAEGLGDDYYVIKSLHPHLLSKEEKKRRLTAEELLVVTDLLITDYSSILFDYLIFQRPLVLFAPDLSEYEEKRGFYMDYRSLPGRLIEREEDLSEGVLLELKEYDREKLKTAFDTYMHACDGKATERILTLLTDHAKLKEET